jgi:hypothetical protein
MKLKYSWICKKYPFKKSKYISSYVKFAFFSQLNCHQWNWTLHLFICKFVFFYMMDSPYISFEPILVEIWRRKNCFHPRVPPLVLTVLADTYLFELGFFLQRSAWSFRQIFLIRPMDPPPKCRKISEHFEI